MPSGGRRRGAGRKPGPPEQVRRNPVRVMLTDAELRALEVLAADRAIPLSTAAYDLLARALKRLTPQRSRARRQ